jgi:hypothetical protein
MATCGFVRFSVQGLNLAIAQTRVSMLSPLLIVGLMFQRTLPMGPYRPADKILMSHPAVKMGNKWLLMGPLVRHVLQAAPSRLLRLIKLALHWPYVPLIRSRLPMHWDESAYCWIERPLTPSHCPNPEDTLNNDVRLDVVRPFHFEELANPNA